MKKYIVPSLLVATALIAGIFAFQPITEASTVHTTIQNSQLQIKTTSNTIDTAGAGTPTTVTATINLNAPFQLLQLSVECAPGDNGAATLLCGGQEDMDIVSIAIDGATTAEAVLIADLAGSDTDGDPTRVLTLAIATDTDVYDWSASDQMVIVIEVDDDDESDATDDGMRLTVRATILTQGDTAFAAAQIGLV